MDKITVTQAIGKFLSWSDAARDAKTTDYYRRPLARLKKAYGGIPLVRLTPADVSAWSQRIEDVRSANRLCNWAYRDARLISHNPLLGLQLPETGARQRILERKTQVMLRRSACSAFRDFATALQETIARPGEIRSATWEQIRIAGNLPATVADLAAGRAYFQFQSFKGKSRRKDRLRVRVIPISPRLGRLLVRLAGRPFHSSRCVFLNSDRRPWTINAVRCQMMRLRKRLGLEADHTGEKIVAYSFRHTGATRAVRNGVRDFRLASLLGHASPRTTERYVHLCPEDIQAAMAAACRKTTA
jgi:integrase